MERKIKYVEHPVTSEEKKKLVNQGYKIIDARFDPDRGKATKRATSKKSENKSDE